MKAVRALRYALVVPCAALALQRVLYGKASALLPNLSRYPVSCFFDTLYHLNEGCQKAHSAAVAAQMPLVLPTQPSDAR